MDCDFFISIWLAYSYLFYLKNAKEKIIYFYINNAYFNHCIYLFYVHLNPKLLHQYSEIIISQTNVQLPISKN